MAYNPFAGGLFRPHGAVRLWTRLALLGLMLAMAACAGNDQPGQKTMPDQSPWGLTPRPKAAKPDTVTPEQAQGAPALERRASQLRVAQDAKSWSPLDMGPERRAPGRQPTQTDLHRVINFKDAPLGEVVGVFAEILGINVVIPAEAKGTVTLQSGGDVRADELMPLLETVLEVNGWALVKDGGGYRLATLSQAKTSAALPRVGRRGLSRGEEGAYGLEVFYLHFLTATQASTNLKRFISPAGEMVAVPAANALVVSESEANLTKIRRLMELLDVPTSRRVGIRVYHVENVPVANLARDLRKIFMAMGISQSPNTGVWVEIVPLPDLDSLAVISSVHEMFTRVEQWLADLDRQLSEAEVGVFVYHCQSGDAQAIANVLSGLYGAPGQQVKKTGTGQEAKAQAPLGLPTELRSQAQPVTAAPSGLTSGFSGTSSLGGRQSAAERRAAAETPLLSRGQMPGAQEEKEEQAATILEGNIRVVVETGTNSLVIRAPRRQYESLLRAIRRLDVFPRQVLIEVLIAEVTLDDSQQLGMDWSITSGSTSATVTSDSALTPSSGLVYALSKADEFKATLKALAANKKVNVISAPLLLAAENQESRISVGDEIPIISNLTTSESVDTDTGKKITDRSIKYRDTGIILSVVPRINDSGLVKLTISQEISEVSNSSYGSTESPSFSKRTATTNVVTTDNQSVVIAGLIKTTTSEQDSGIPFLKDIPLLGYAFKVDKQVKQRTELVITLTPYVIHDMADARQIVNDLKEEQKRLRLGQPGELPARGGTRPQEPSGK